MESPAAKCAGARVQGTFAVNGTDTPEPVSGIRGGGLRVAPNLIWKGHPRCAAVLGYPPPFKGVRLNQEEAPTGDGGRHLRAGASSGPIWGTNGGRGNSHQDKIALFVSSVNGITMSRRFPPPWSVEQIPGGYKVKDADGQALAYVYARETRCRKGDGAASAGC